MQIKQWHVSDAMYLKSRSNGKSYLTLTRDDLNIVTIPIDVIKQIDLVHIEEMTHIIREFTSI